jgi:hypothetical protein
MTIDQEWIRELRSLPDLDSRDILEVDGVDLTMPVRRSNLEPARAWRRRVLPDVIPDYPLADAPEKMLYRILKRITDPQQTDRTLDGALAGEFTRLIPLYEATTLGKNRVPVSFHVLTVNSLREPLRCRVFREKTFLLLCRNPDGELNEALVRDFIEKFRRSPDELELSQSLLIERLHPNWRREDEFCVHLEPFLEPVRPFLTEAASHFQRDLRTLLRVDVPHSHFFRLVNQLLALHYGMYQCRLAKVLNPAVSRIIAWADNPTAIDVPEIETIEGCRHPAHQFNGSYTLRVTDLSGKRRLPLNHPARQSYLLTEKELLGLHFSLLMLNRIRHATTCYLRQTLGLTEESALDELVRLPSQIAERLRTDERYRQFLLRAFEAISLRYIQQEVTEENRSKGLDLLKESRNALDAMKGLLELEERTRSGSTKSHSAVVSGSRVFNALLAKGDSGIVNSRRGVGKYLELGMGLVPLLLLLIVGDREKVQLDTFWGGLAEYGFRFEPEDRELLLARLKMMGLFERFSDAGEANYVRSLMKVA